MDIIALPIEDLSPNPDNPRVHTSDQINQIASSIKEFGFLNPIIVDEKNMVLAGHGRFLAAQTLGSNTVPVHKIDNLTDQQKQAFTIADNNIALNSDWDNELLWAEIKKLEENGYDLNLLAFSDIEIMPMVDPNVVLDPLEEWQDMPDYNQDDLKPMRSVLVHFESQADVDTFFSLIGQSHTEKTKSIWYPEQEEFTVRDRRYE